MKFELKLGTSFGATKNIPKYIVIHTSDDSYRNAFDQFNKINTYHRDYMGFPKSMAGLFGGYHYLYTGNKEYKYREEDEVGAHCNQGFDGVKVYPPGTAGAQSMNYQSISLCTGNDGDIEYPTADQYGRMQKRVWAIQNKYGITNDKVFFHRKFATSKTCPGTLITPQWLADLLHKPSPIVPKSPEASCTALEAENKALKEEVATWKQSYSWIDEILNKYFRKT